MEWTSDSIRAKADAMERRLDRPVSSVSGETLLLVVQALRFYADAMDRRPPDAYVVEAWSGRAEDRGRTVAMSDKFELAKVAYDAMCALEPRSRVTLRQGGRSISLRDSSAVQW